MSTATKIFYVLPDNSTNASCPSQPCATLSQYWLHNGTLPVVSNVEYHFLPGEHHVPANMVLQNLHNFSIIGTISNNSSLPTVLIGCSQSFYVIYITNSFFVTITDVIFKHCNLIPKNITRTNLKLNCCFSCKIENIVLVQYGIIGYNLIGRSYLNNVKVETIQFSKFCCRMVILQYATCEPWHKYSNHTHYLTINQLFIQNDTTRPYKNMSVYDNSGLQILLDRTKYHVNTVVTNSKFLNMNQRALLIITSRYSHTKSHVFIINCTFGLITVEPGIRAYVSPFNETVSFINCKFHSNVELIAIIIEVCSVSNDCKQIITNATMSTSMMLTNVSFVKCEFISNINRIILAENQYPISSNLKANILFESLIISHNYASEGKSSDTISITTMNVHINGTLNVTYNKYKKSTVNFQSCDILFSGKIIFFKNDCKELSQQTRT